VPFDFALLHYEKHVKLLMMLYKNLFFQKTDGLGIITLNRPEVSNTIDARLAEELGDICAQINYNEEIRVVIITGAGQKAFSAGTDLGEIYTEINGGQELRLLSVATPVANLRSPVIAAINGDAIGQGLELALSCDLRVCLESARFGLPHVSQGLTPWDGATQRLPRLVGKAKAMEMILMGHLMNSSEAYRIGLVHKVVSGKEILPAATDMAQTIAAKAPLALRYAKEALHNGLELTLEQGLRLEADLYFLLQTTEDRAEGIRAFLEKRPPRFTGN